MAVWPPASTRGNKSAADSLSDSMWLASNCQVNKYATRKTKRQRATRFSSLASASAVRVEALPFCSCCSANTPSTASEHNTTIRNASDIANEQNATSLGIGKRMTASSKTLSERSKHTRPHMQDQGRATESNARKAKAPPETHATSAARTHGVICATHRIGKGLASSWPNKHSQPKLFGGASLAFESRN